MVRTGVLQHLSEPGAHPVHDASQTGFRIISGEIPATDSRVSLSAWALVFKDTQLTNANYQQVVLTLGAVGADGLILAPLDGVPGDRFGSMSERPGLSGDLINVWVTSYANSGDERGAVLARLHGTLLQLLAIDPFVAKVERGPVRMVERISERMASRERDLPLPPEADTMSRLPVLTDTYAWLEQSRIEVNRYWVQN